MGTKKLGNLPRKKKKWPSSERLRDTIDLHTLPAHDEINGARIRALTGDDRFPDSAGIILRTFRAIVGERKFHVGFCVGDGHRFSAIGIAVIERLRIEVPDGAMYVAPVVHEDIAWDVVRRHLQTFDRKLLLFAFSDSDVYDAGIGPINYSPAVRQFGLDGEQFERLSVAQQRAIRLEKSKILERPPPELYLADGLKYHDVPWIFRIETPAGKQLRVAVWNGRRDYSHELPDGIERWVGGNRIAIVQVDSPVGVNRRSSVLLTHHLAKDFDGIIHWARDTETFESINSSFVRLDLESAEPPELPDDWQPEITIFGANG